MLAEWDRTSSLPQDEEVWFVYIIISDTCCSVLFVYM